MVIDSGNWSHRVSSIVLRSFPQACRTDLFSALDPGVRKITVWWIAYYPQEPHPRAALSLLSTVYAPRANVTAGGLEDLQQTLIPDWMDHCDELKDSLGESKMKLGVGGGHCALTFFFLIMIIVCLRDALEIFLINIRAMIKLLVVIFLSETGVCEMLQELNLLRVAFDSANSDS